MTHQTHGSVGMKVANVLSDKKTVLLALGSVGAVTALGMSAAAVYNSRRMRTARALKRTGKVLYTVGTTMRNISGMEM